MASGNTARPADEPVGLEGAAGGGPVLPLGVVEGAVAVQQVFRVLAYLNQLRFSCEKLGSRSQYLRSTIFTGCTWWYDS